MSAASRTARALAVGLLLAAPAFAQEEDDEGTGPVPFDHPGIERRREADRNRLNIPTWRPHETRCREAEAYERAGDWAAAARAYLEVLREERDPESGIQRVVRVGEGRYVSYARFARERLLSFPEEGRRAFRELADAEARSLFDAALAARDAGALDALWRTYPLASVADQALERLGDLALEAGEMAAAASIFERAAAIEGGDLDPKRLAAKAARARKASSAAPPAAASRPPAPTRWPVLGGDAAHAAPLPALPGIGPARSVALLPPSRASQAFGLRGARRVAAFERGTGFVTRDDAFPDTVPVADHGRLVLTTSNAAVCYDTATGERRWYQGVWTGQDQCGDLFTGATIAEGVVVASFVRSISRPEYYRGIPIREAIPHRRLVGIDLATGKRLWDHAESEDEFLRRASVALAPVARGGTLYAGATVADGAFKCYLIAVDAASGKLLWRRYLGSGQMELTMFGEPAREPLSMQPAERAGTIFHATGFGHAAAVSALSGEIQWLVTYDTIPIEPARTYYAVLRDLPWRSGPPVVHDETVVATPIDSSRAYAWDARTGQVRWTIESAGVLRRLLGVDGGRAVFQGDRLHAVDVRSGKLVAAFPGQNQTFSEEEAGRGLLCAGVAVIPFPSRIARVDLGAGTLLPDLSLPGGIKDSGTLLYIGKDLVSVNPQRATTFQVVEDARAGALGPGAR